MRKFLDIFQKRWNTVVNETLSSVRRQLANFNFDNSVVNKDFHDSSAEWFEGELAPRLWFQQLTEENPEIAKNFKEYVTGIRICEQTVSKPSQWGGYVITALALLICYCLLDCDWITKLMGTSDLTEMSRIIKLAIYIVTAVLVWNICQLSAIKKKYAYEKRVVDLYRQQLEEHFKKIMNILA